MAVVQINPPGLASTAEGYVSSITVRTGGSATVLTPNATTGQVAMSAEAATQMCSEHLSDNAKLILGGAATSL